MNSRAVRIVLITVGVIALLIGGVFAGQGSGLIPGSVMTGERLWLNVGIVLAVFGIVLIVLGARRPRKNGTGS
jgi:uncharacterized membrane protein YdbT with pleckstrin-like domain